ncbi:hypothetical protein H9I45_15690 [Polaribacter haliotis]|uniref:HTH luxR-type domain-containing protein n=1 Tax=Polaribacter haliotis TaxID=1888915 RepID=A0A7L8AFH7_9FLAO|nr:hypothetical protein [Polaribacter haliotis]QOD60761.1 hypothetical protein H9I45_15690 [Polaribacter haliotis]
MKSGSDWHYYDQGSLNDDWMLSNDFSNWNSGPAPIGYGDTKLKTTISFGNSKEKKDIVKYFKKRIQINNENFVAYEFKILRDDGIVLYIDGKEILRNNMPDITISSNTLAKEIIDRDNEKKYLSFIFESNIFKKNEAILSVSIHQVRPKSSDCLFDLELIGHKNPNILKTVVDNKSKKNLELLNKIDHLNEKFEYEKVVLRNESLHNHIYSLKIVIFLLAILLIIGFIVSYYLLLRCKNKGKEIQKNNEILKNNILEKEKEMVTSTTNLLYNKQYFKEIKADLKSIKTEDNNEIKSILKHIDYILDRDKDWEILKKHFNAVNDGFYDKIIKVHPNLSETELRHCIFIKLHMHTKEIAKILLIDPRSVQTARYRIKKKMNLGEDEDLRDYLLNFE